MLLSSSGAGWQADRRTAGGQRDGRQAADFEECMKFCKTNTTTTTPPRNESRAPRPQPKPAWQRPCIPPVPYFPTLAHPQPVMAPAVPTAPRD